MVALFKRDEISRVRCFIGGGRKSDPIVTIRYPKTMLLFNDEL